MSQSNQQQPEPLTHYLYTVGTKRFVDCLSDTSNDLRGSTDLRQVNCEACWNHLSALMGYLTLSGLDLSQMDETGGLPIDEEEGVLTRAVRSGAGLLGQGLGTFVRAAGRAASEGLQD